MKAVSELLCSSDNPAPDNYFVNISVRLFKFQFFLSWNKNLQIYFYVQLFCSQNHSFL